MCKVIKQSLVQCVLRDNRRDQFESTRTPRVRDEKWTSRVVWDVCVTWDCTNALVTWSKSLIGAWIEALLSCCSFFWRGGRRGEVFWVHVCKYWLLVVLIKTQIFVLWLTKRTVRKCLGPLYSVHCVLAKWNYQPPFYNELAVTVLNRTR